MIEIRNKTPGPVQIIVRSFSERRTNAKAFTVLNIPGFQIREISDERAIDLYLNRAKREGLITTRYVEN